MEDTISVKAVERENESHDIVHDKLDVITEEALSLNIKTEEFPGSETNEPVAKDCKIYPDA